MSKIDLNKTFYLIAEYYLGDLQGFIKIGDDKEEIMKVFEDKYMFSFGVTEQSFELLEVNAKVIANNRGIIDTGINNNRMAENNLEDFERNALIDFRNTLKELLGE